MDTKAVQERILRNKVNKGFNVTDIHLEFCLMAGEMAEAHRAWREKKPDYGEELADIAIYLLGLAEITGVDLGAEIERKMDINEKRVYKMKDGIMQKEQS